MKKFILGFITAAVLFGGLAAVATVGLRDVRVADDVSLYVHGQRVQTDIVHAVRDDHPYGWGRNYVSARDLAEALGYFVDWCEATGRILVDRVPPVTVTQAGHALVGTWEWEGDTNWQYNFNYNGTGVRGMPGNLEAFDWRIPSPGLLMIYTNDFAYYESWDYSIATNGWLVLYSNIWDGVMYEYIRAGTQPPATAGQIDPTLVGSWTWDEDANYIYIFNNDGTGTRGWFGFEETFTWSIPDSGQLNIYRDHAPLGEIRNERWNYTIVGNVLTMDSRQVAGLTFSYIRYTP